MLKKKIVIFITTFIICMCAHAQSDSDTLTNLLLNITTMKADFVQTIKDKSAKSLQQSQGRMALQRPGKFRWEVTQPIAQLIIANGTRLWIYDKDLEQVTIRSFHKAAGQTPALLLSDKNLTLGKDFVVREAKNPSQIAGSQLFLLTPKDKEDPFESIKLTFIQKQIREMQLADRLGHITTIAFQHVQVGMPLSAATFTFKAVPNIDVIDETKNKPE